MTAEVTELNQVVANLSPEMVRRVVDYARLLTSPTQVEYDMDDPTEEELRHMANLSMQRFEEEHPGEDWSQQPYTPGYK